MQFTIVIAMIATIGGIVFAAQNNVPITASVLFWRFDGTLASVVLLAMAIGASVVTLLILPASMRRRWLIKRQKRRIDEMESATAILRSRLDELEPARGLSQAEVDAEQTGYVGLKQLISGH